MKAATIENNTVTNIIIVDSLDVLPGLVDGAGAHIGDTWDGVKFSRDGFPPPTQTELTVDDYRAAIQTMLDTKVRERRYYDILSACSYASSTNATFRAEAAACIAWRDVVWAKAYEALDQVQSGAALQPTIAGLLAMLPALTWPS